VGAGASWPYGYPLGPELYNRARALTPSSNMWQLIRHAKIAEADTITAMLDDMRDHPAPSIDAYLLTRQDRKGFVQIAKAMIALLMAQAVMAAEEHRVSRVEDWLEKVFAEMAAGAATWQDFADGNAVSFVTFNFDSVIEKRLRQELQRQYRGQSAFDADRALKRIPIIHVHGILPGLPGLPIEANPMHDLNPEWIEWTAKAANEINIIHDNCDEGIRQSGCAAVREAQVVCFLGFAYHPDNIRRLELPKNFGPSVQIFGSAYGMTESDRSRVASRMGRPVTLASASRTARGLFDDLPVFRE
jgi:hypothetical protein